MDIEVDVTDDAPFRERCPYCGREGGVSEEHILNCGPG